MSLPPTAASPRLVAVNLTPFTKEQVDLLRMSLLLACGHRYLTLARDGSSISVELPVPIQAEDIYRMVGEAMKSA